MNATSNTKNGPQKADSVDDSSGMSPEELERQPFDVNDPAGTDAKTSEQAAEDDGMSPEELKKQPFNVNDPAGTDDA